MAASGAASGTGGTVDLSSASYTGTADIWTWGAVFDGDDTDYSGGGGGGDGGDGQPFLYGGKDCVIFLIDCTQSMFEDFDEETESLDPTLDSTATSSGDRTRDSTRDGGDDGEADDDMDATGDGDGAAAADGGGAPRSRTRSYFQRCIQAAHNVLSNKIVSSDSDLVGVVFFGTDKHNNETDFKHVYIYQGIDQPFARRILDLEELKESTDFETKFGHSDDYSLNDALWTCANMFSSVTTKVATRRVLIFTNNDQPHATDAGLQRQAKTKANDLRDVGIELELISMNKTGTTFDTGAFYGDILTIDDASHGTSKFEALLDRVRTKAHRKRAMMTIPFKICEGLEIGVKVYNLVSETKKGTYKWLETKSNIEVQTKTRYYCSETMQPLLAESMKYTQQLGKEDKVVFEKDEVAKIKRFDDPGIVLMGFKPRARLKKQYNVKNSSFLYPDETVIVGSTTPFLALLNSMVANKVVAICRIIPRVTSQPMFVALVPQLEVVDDTDGTQVTPPGMHIVYLPYSDDLRKLKYERMTEGDGRKASDDEVDTMRKIVKKLQFANFSADAFENPALQHHYKTLEAMALRRDEMDMPPDLTVPDTERMTKKAGKYIRAFEAAVYGDDYDPDARKRKAASSASGGGTKRARKDPVDLSSLDFKKMYMENTLGKQTVPTLKAYLKSVGEAISGKKSDLIDRIETYLSEQGA